MFKERLKKIFDYILAITMVINCNTIWNYMFINKINTIVLFITLVIAILIGFKERFLYEVKFLLMIGFITSYNVIFILFNNGDKVNFVFNFIILFLLFIIYNFINLNNGNLYLLLFKVVNIIVILAVISVVLYLLCSIFKVINPTSYLKYRWGENRYIPSYYNIYYETQTIFIHGNEFIRNTGIFTEAPMYSFVLLFALIVEIFLNTKSKNMFKLMKIVVLILTIFTTFSTTGIVLSLLSLCIFIFKSINKKNIFKIIVFCLIIIVFLAISGYFIYSKLLNSSNGSFGSYAARLGDFKAGIYAWNNNKIFGVGYKQYQYVQQYMDLLIRGYGGAGGSSALNMILSEGGIVFLIFYLLPLVFSFIYSVLRKNFNIFFIFIIFYIALIFTAVPYRYIVIYFLSIGFIQILMKDN
ncbi:O-antigen ligase family protein [uncultured Clostridium sp.]|uniref:O-antigen ligase family protein n=1 Tax=uncultured Clostridium sp. TaxID=59620 RepID=UPI00258C27B0|nr:O-antigen ligase family protein [uncultured Clostridium sp.]